MPDRDDDPPPPIVYEPRGTVVTIRGMRWLLALTLLNTILLGGYVLGPGLGSYLQSQWTSLRGQWDSWQQARAARKLAPILAARRAPIMKTEAPALAYVCPRG